MIEGYTEIVTAAVIERPVSEEVGAALLDSVDRVLRRKKFNAPCRDDVRQEVVLWLLNQRINLAEFPPGDRLVSTLASRFLRTKNRARLRPTRFEPAGALASLGQASRCDSSLSKVEAKARVEALPQIAASLMRLVLQGFTWAEACAELRVAAGSRSYLRKQAQDRF